MPGPKYHRLVENNSLEHRNKYQVGTKTNEGETHFTLFVANALWDSSQVTDCDLLQKGTSICTHFSAVILRSELGIKSRTSPVLDQCSVTELQTQPHVCYSFPRKNKDT